MQIRVIFALPSLVPPSLGALGSCPSRPPLDPPLVGSEKMDPRLCPRSGRLFGDCSRPAKMINLSDCMCHSCPSNDAQWSVGDLCADGDVEPHSFTHPHGDLSSIAICSGAGERVNDEEGGRYCKLLHRTWTAQPIARFSTLVSAAPSPIHHIHCYHQTAIIIIIRSILQLHPIIILHINIVPLTYNRISSIKEVMHSPVSVCVSVIRITQKTTDQIFTKFNGWVGLRYSSKAEITCYWSKRTYCLVTRWMSCIDSLPTISGACVPGIYRLLLRQRQLMIQYMQVAHTEMQS